MYWLQSRTLDKLRLRVRSVVLRERLDDEVDVELSFHLEQQIEENLTAGMSPEEARSAARRAIGGIAQIKDQCRDTRRVGWVTDLVGDVRYAGRTFARTPGLAITIIVILALGIGANTAVFSIIDALLLRSLPLPDPERLIQILQPDGPMMEEYGELFSLDDYRSMSESASPFAQLAAETGTKPVSVSIGASEETVRRDAISGNYFATLGVDCAAGRAIVSDDVNRGGVAVISHVFWERRFNRDPQVIGRSLRIGQQAYTIVGITRAGFFGVEQDGQTDIWTPIARKPRGDRPVRILGRLNPGVGNAQALGPLQVLFHDHMLQMIRHAPPGTPVSLVNRLRQLTLKVVPASKGLSSLRVEYGKPLQIVFAIVAIVLLTACLNVACLLLTRATTRQREMAVRASLGADRWRLLRQMLAESLLLSGCATVLGVAAAHWIAPLLANLLARSDSRIDLALTIDGHMLVFSAVVCASVTLSFGFLPAWRYSNVDVNSALKSAAPGVSGNRVRTGRVVVASQIALSLLLLIAGSLFVRTLENLYTSDIGFARRNVVLAPVQFRGTVQGNLPRQYWNQLLHRVSMVPGVESASLASGSVFKDAAGVGAIRFPDSPVDPHELAGCVLFQASPNLFQTIGTPILAGRDFESRDFEARALPVAIVSQAFSRAYFGDASPIGKRFSNFEEDPPNWITVIGVAKDTRHGSIRAPMQPIAYLPYTWPSPASTLWVVVRTHAFPEALATALLKAAAEVSPQFVIGQAKTQERLIDDSLLRERLLAAMASTFAVLALLIAAVGLYGLISYTAARRAQEIGIRLAIGAAPRDLVRMIVRESLFTIVGGLSFGLALSITATRWIASLLFDVRAVDPLSIAAAMTLLAGIAFVAAWIPARRAARTDPMIALRCE